jgi:hypothetical protein
VIERCSFAAAGFALLISAMPSYSADDYVCSISTSNSSTLVHFSIEGAKLASTLGGLFGGPMTIARNDPNAIIAYALNGKGEPNSAIGMAILMIDKKALTASATVALIDGALGPFSGPCTPASP